MSIAIDALKTLPELGELAIEREVKAGDLFLCSGNHAFSRLIRWATKSRPWSHVAMAMRVDAVERVMVLESVEKFGVQVLPLHTFLFGDQGKRPYPGQVFLARHAKVSAASPSDIARMAQFGIDQLGDPFAAFEVLKIAARITVGSLNRKTSDFLTSPNKYICSEYVAKCFDQIGAHTPWDGRGFIAPCDFAANPEVSAIARVRIVH